MQTNETPQAFDRRTSIWNSLYAAVLGIVDTRTEHPGYEDITVTRECARQPLSEQHLAWLDWLMGREVES